MIIWWLLNMLDRRSYRRWRANELRRLRALRHDELGIDDVLLYECLVTELEAQKR